MVIISARYVTLYWPSLYIVVYKYIERIKKFLIYIIINLFKVCTTNWYHSNALTANICARFPHRSGNFTISFEHVGLFSHHQDRKAKFVIRRNARSCLVSIILYMYWIRTHVVLWSFKFMFQRRSQDSANF